MQELFVYNYEGFFLMPAFIINSIAAQTKKLTSTYDLQILACVKLLSKGLKKQYKEFELIRTTEHKWNIFQTIKLQKNLYIIICLDKLEDLLISSLTIYYTTKQDLEKILAIAEKCKIVKKAKVCLHIVSQSYSGLALNTIDITTKILPWNNLDTHYPATSGSFETFYKNLCKKIKTTNKGIVFLYGDPGTGKTFCIRHLISDLSEHKNFVLIPNSLMSEITTPVFIKFLLEIVRDKEDKRDIVLILEDTEELIQSRENVQNQNIADLLNITDGLFNDILNFIVIATFNTDLTTVDKALLRNGRLIAHKKFSKLTLKQAQEFIKASKLNIEAKEGMTLADIYTEVNNNTLLEHNLDSEEKKLVGFN